MLLQIKFYLDRCSVPCLWVETLKVPILEYFGASVPTSSPIMAKFVTLYHQPPIEINTDVCREGNSVPVGKGRCLYCVIVSCEQLGLHFDTDGRCAGAYTADTANAVPLFWLVRHTMHFAVPLFRSSNNNFPINFILGAVSRRNEIMFTVSLFWHYLQNNIVQIQFLK